MANPYFAVKSIISYSCTKYEKCFICGAFVSDEIKNY